MGVIGINGDALEPSGTSGLETRRPGVLARALARIGVKAPGEREQTESDAGR
jgi:hypothetical protein